MNYGIGFGNSDSLRVCSDEMLDETRCGGREGPALMAHEIDGSRQIDTIDSAGADDAGFDFAAQRSRRHDRHAEATEHGLLDRCHAAQLCGDVRGDPRPSACFVEMAFSMARRVPEPGSRRTSGSSRSSSSVMVRRSDHRWSAVPPQPARLARASSPADSVRRAPS